VMTFILIVWRCCNDVFDCLFDEVMKRTVDSIGAGDLS
jgi:hypothetical protein